MRQLFPLLDFAKKDALHHVLEPTLFAQAKVKNIKLTQI